MQRPSRVVIWHSMDLPQHAYMYEGVVATIIDALGAATDAPTIVYGQGIRRQHKAAYQGNLSLLQRGDALIWIGYGFADGATPWTELGRRGIRRVFYQCEPEHRCASRTAGRYAVDEMWDFAWHNIEACSTAPTPPRLRYVPLGAASMYALPLRLPLPSAHPGPLLFFGNVRDGPPRHRCFTELRRTLLNDRAAGKAGGGGIGSQQRRSHGQRGLGDLPLTHTFRAFDDASFRALLGAHAVWLNLHKGCGDAHNPVTFRVAKALLAGRLILSERAHEKDEAEFEGLGISFHDNMSAIAAAYKLAVREYDAPGSPALAAVEQRVRAFRARFAPARIFQRAQIYKEWGLSLMDSTRSMPTQ